MTSLKSKESLAYFCGKTGCNSKELTCSPKQSMPPTHPCGPLHGQMCGHMYKCVCNSQELKRKGLSEFTKQSTVPLPLSKWSFLQFIGSSSCCSYSSVSWQHRSSLRPEVRSLCFPPLTCLECWHPSSWKFLLITHLETSQLTKAWGMFIKHWFGQFD